MTLRGVPAANMLRSIANRGRALKMGSDFRHTTGSEASAARHLDIPWIGAAGEWGGSHCTSHGRLLAR
jgi:hypothetical protein